MKTKTYKELYTLVLEKLESGYGCSGTCQVISKLDIENSITEKEYCKLEGHFKKQKPTARNKFNSFYEDPLFIGGLWWWRRMKEGEKNRAVRISFIKAILSTL